MFSRRLKVGILGGGQLGSMLIRHAIDFGFELSVLDKDPNASCVPYVRQFTEASPLDYDSVVAFGQDLDVLTVEMEAVNVDALRKVRDQGVAVYPSPELLQIIQDKGLQKSFLQEHNFPVAAGVMVEGRDALRSHTIQFPVCIKQRRGGYDGQGVMMLRSAADIDKAFDAPSVLEEVVDIEQEFSVIVARNPNGQTVVYDPVTMVFHPERFVLEYQESPAVGLTKAQIEESRSMAERLASEIELVGLLAVEMFLSKDGRVLINELAPRPHNSGHHTIEACVTSQYEQLLRAVSGLPLGSPDTVLPSVMLNYLEPEGSTPEGTDTRIVKMLELPGVHVHWYGKTGGRTGRKMGHITVTGRTREEALQQANSVRTLLATN